MMSACGLIQRHISWEKYCGFCCYGWAEPSHGFSFVSASLWMKVVWQILTLPVCCVSFVCFLHPADSHSFKLLLPLCQPAEPSFHGLIPMITWITYINTYISLAETNSNIQLYIQHVNLHLNCICTPLSLLICRWFCYRFFGADSSEPSLCIKKDVRQQWTRPAGLQTWDTDYGE